MELMLLSTMFFVFFMAYVFVQLSARKTYKAKSDSALQQIFLLRKLIALVQVHRGKTIAQLGSVSRDNNREIKNIETSLEAQLTKLDATATTINSARWQHIKLHWQSKCLTWQQKDIAMNFYFHNTLVQEVLYLIDDTIHYASPTSNEKSTDLDILCASILPTIEYLGQTRAVGVQATSGGACDSVSRIRLNFLGQKIEQDFIASQHNLKLDKAINTAIDNVLKNMRSNIMGNKTLLSSEEWFAICSEAMEKLYQLFDHRLSRLSQH